MLSHRNCCISMLQSKCFLLFDRQIKLKTLKSSVDFCTVTCQLLPANANLKSICHLLLQGNPPWEENFSSSGTMLTFFLNIMWTFFVSQELNTVFWCIIYCKLFYFGRLEYELAASMLTVAWVAGLIWLSELPRKTKTPHHLIIYLSPFLIPWW